MYVELHCHTPYSYLDGASTIEELVRQAALYGMPALAITDHNTLTAAVKFHECCEQYGIRPIYGTEVTMADGTHLTLLAKSREGYGNICRLLSTAYAIGGRLTPALPWDQLPLHAAGVICLTGCRNGKISSLIRNHRHLEALIIAQQLKDIFGDDLYVELQDDLTPHAARVCHELVLLARRIGARIVATNNVHFATADGMIAHDVKRCIAMGITVAENHVARPFNSERHLKSAKEMCDLFAWAPNAVATSMLIAEQCSGDGIMPLGEEITPAYPTANGESAVEHLRTLAYEGARRRRGSFTRQGKERLDYELKLLAELGYTDFVLHAARIVRWARGEGIMVTGRGSGADSEVCYCLGLTDVDVLERNLPVARWVGINKRPDVDLDFEARRRDDVFRWVSKTYGEENVALCCTYIQFWSKSALRDVGKALALPPQTLAWFSKHMSGFQDASKIVEAFGRNPELRAYASLTKRFELLFDLCSKIAGHPRHAGSHSSGLVLSRIPLSSLNVLTPSARGVLPIVMLDKDDVENGLNAVKLDILSLPILSVVKDTERDIQRSDADFTYENIPREDRATYMRLWQGQNCGIFQLGSPAQAALATTLHPLDFEHLVAAIGLIRPGSIRARSVQKYVAARNGYARIEYLHPVLKPILERTYGTCVFQEQVAYIIGAMMDLSDNDAEAWRKRLSKHAGAGTMIQARDEFINRSLRFHPDLSIENSQAIFLTVEAFQSLAFVEGHSASFALTAQKTAYMVCHNPVQYYAALMSNQPCGFYPPQTLAAEARRRGAQILPLSINDSALSCTTDDEATSIRIGFCLLSGIRTDDVDSILAERENGEYRSLLDFCVRLPLRRDLLESLILCGAFDDLHDFNRRGLIWRLNETIVKAQAIRADAVSSQQQRLDLRLVGATATPIAWDIEDFSDWDKLLWEWRIISVTTSCHPFAHLRTSLAARGVITAFEAMKLKTGYRATVAGLNIRPHRPPSKSGGRHLFCTIEDESAYMQAAFYGDNIENNMATILLSPAVIVRGKMVRKGYGSSMEVEKAWPLSIRDFRPAAQVESEQDLVEVARTGARSYR